MIKNTVILLLFSLFATALFAEEKTTLSTADKFAKATHTYQGASLPFRIFTPEAVNPNAKYPLVVALHGMGERGNDNNLQLSASRMATCWAETTSQSKNPCYVIAPQCPITSGWADSPVKDVLFNLVESALRTYNIDPERVYITGLSMGGNGTWTCISLRPDLFAAAVPIAGWGNTAKGPVLKNIPIWAYHGHSDDVVSVDNSRFMVEAIVSQGIDAIYTHCFYVDTRTMSLSKLTNELKAHPTLLYTELLGYTHNVWDYAYNDKAMVSWLFSKRKQVANALTLATCSYDTIVNGTVDLHWTTSFVKDSVEIWFKSERQESWKLLKKELAANQSFNWNTDAENECIYGKLRFCLLDSNALVYYQCESGIVTIDREGNCPPWVKLHTPDFIKASNIISKRIDVNYIANDAESDSVRVIFNYSADNGKTYSTIDSVRVVANNEMKIQTILFSKLPKTNNGILKLMVYDEQRLVHADSTLAFSNQLGTNPVSVHQTSLYSDGLLMRPTPNPADQSCRISLQIPHHGNLKLAFYNAMGQLVMQENEFIESGQQEKMLSTALLPNGLYRCVVSFDAENKAFSIQKSVSIIVLH